MSNNQRRLLLDGFLSVMLVLAMQYQFTGNLLHEVAGAVFTLAVLVHLGLSMRWAKITARNVRKGKKLKGAAKVSIFMGIALLVACVVMAVTSVMISQQLVALGVGAFYVRDMSLYPTVVLAHTVSSYAIAVLTVIHLALHWKFIVSVVSIPYNPSRRRAIGTAVAGVAALGCLAVAKTGFEAAAEQVAYAAELAEMQEAAAAEAAAQVKAQEEAAMAASDKPQPEAADEQPADSEQLAQPEVSQPEPESELEPELELEPEPAPKPTSSGSVSGICYLCKKRCPLSNPLCDRPYLEGLL